MRPTWRFSTALFLAFGPLVAVTAQQNMKDDEQNKAWLLGAQLAERVRSQTTPLHTEWADHYLAGLGLRLATEIPSAGQQWQFTVVTDPGNWAHEPLGLPGGCVFVPSALFASEENEAEFGAMLAHSIIHAAWPAFVSRNRENIPLFLPTSLERDHALLVPLNLQAAQREREIQADALAVQIISRAGFDPDALLAYLERQRFRNVPQSQAEGAAVSGRLAYLSETLALLSNSSDRRVSSSNFTLAQDGIRAAERASSKQHKVPSLLASGN